MLATSCSVVAVSIGVGAILLPWFTVKTQASRDSISFHGPGAEMYKSRGPLDLAPPLNSHESDDHASLLQTYMKGSRARESPSALEASFGRLLPVSVVQRRFVDSAGRERSFRGVNVVYKDPPWLPNVTKFHSNLSFVQDDVDLLASLGVNLIRLGVMWPGVVPRRRGVVDVEYLIKVQQIIHMAEAAGIYTIVEPHQDELSSRFCGEGVPDWLAEELFTQTNFPAPLKDDAAPFSKPPTREECNSRKHEWDYLWTDDLARAFQTFWERGAQDFSFYWQVVARFFAGEPAVIGGELWNEPFPGDIFKNITSLSQPLFGNYLYRNNSYADAHNLMPLYQNVTNAIRIVENQSQFAIAYENSWPVGNQHFNHSSVLPPTSGFSTFPERNAIYAFHYYVPPCTKNFTHYFDGREADARRLDAVLFASEFNLDSESKDMLDIFRALESRLISYTGWQYKSYSGSLPNGTCTGCGNSFFRDNGTLIENMTVSMARPFAGAVAGRIVTSDFDHAAKVFKLSYRTRPTQGAPTEIVVPGQWFPSPVRLNVTVQGDDNAVITVKMFDTGRMIAPGVLIRSYRKVYITHNATAAQDGAMIFVTLRTM